MTFSKALLQSFRHTPAIKKVISLYKEWFQVWLFDLAISAFVFYPQYFGQHLYSLVFTINIKLNLLYTFFIVRN